MSGLIIREGPIPNLKASWNTIMMRLAVRMRRAIFPAILAAGLTVNPVQAAEPVSTGPAQGPAWSLEGLLQRVSPLKHDPAGRLPLITWEPFRLTPEDKSFDEGKPLPDEMYREIGRRGFTQRLPMDVKYIPMALAIQRAGLPVVFMEGAGGNGPRPSEDPEHELPEGFKLEPGEGHFFHPMLIDGWQRRADGLRATLRKFKDAGVKVTAAWLDWEEEPQTLPDRWLQAAMCSKCRAMFPPGTLDSLEAYTLYINQLKRHVLSAYLAAPIREIYPDCSITNWALTFSSLERPTRSIWGDKRMPPGDLGLFTAANPVVYGNNLYFLYHWKKEWRWPLDVAHMDRLYTEIMLGNFSDNAANQLHIAPWGQSVPWVARYCPDLDVKEDVIPILSRERYREILRHVWLRGADSMQLFNALRSDHPVIATEEVEDVVTVYDEFLAYRDILDQGWVLNTEPPQAQDDGAIWSGLGLGRRALIRAFTQGAASVSFTIKPWADGPAVTLEAPPEGRTWLLSYEPGDLKVTEGPH